MTKLLKKQALVMSLPSEVPHEFQNVFQIEFAQPSQFYTVGFGVGCGISR